MITSYFILRIIFLLLGAFGIGLIAGLISNNGQVALGVAAFTVAIGLFFILRLL